MSTRLLIAFLLSASLVIAAATAQQQTTADQPEATTETPAVQPVPESAPAAPTMPKAEPVLQHIPADAIAFVVVNDVGGVAGEADNYLTAVGLTPLLAEKMPNGVLELIKSAAQLGEGFNPNGGFAVALLPPEKFGVDIDKLMAPAKKADAEEQPASAPAKKEKLPLLLLVPGTGVKEVFGSYEQVPVGKYTEVSLRMGKMLVTQLGGYVALSPRADVLDSLATLDKNITSQLTPEQADMLARSLIAFHADFTSASGTMDKLFTNIEATLSRLPIREDKPDLALRLRPLLAVERQLLSQLESVTAGLRLEDTGLAGEMMVSYKPDSDIGKALASVTPPACPPLNRLPNLPYVYAVGGTGSNKMLGQTRQTTPANMMDKLITAGVVPKMDEESLKALKELITLSQEEVTEMQFVAGGAPEGSGLVGIAAVLRCNDSARLKDAIVDKVPVMINSMIEKAAKEGQSGTIDTEKPPLTDQQNDPPQESVATQPAEAASSTETAQTEPATAPAESKVKLVVSKAAETIDDVPVDAVEIVLPADTREVVAQQLGTVFGEDKLRILLAATDDKTVVITFGGAKAFLAETVKTAKAGDGTILAEEGTVEAMKHLPKNPMAVGLFNAGNLFDLIRKITAAMAPQQGGQPPLPFQIVTKTPIAFGTGVTGTTQHTAFYIPSELVKEVSGIVGMLTGRMAPPPQTQGTQDF